MDKEVDLRNVMRRERWIGINEQTRQKGVREGVPEQDFFPFFFLRHGRERKENGDQENER